MYARSTALIGLCLPLLAVASLGRPAQAGREVSSIRGSYFGNFFSNGGDIWQTDMTLSFQSSRRIGGQLNVAGTIQNLPITGSYAGSGRITLTGKSSRGQRPFRIKLSGKVQPAAEQDRVNITGTYTTSGAVRESGTFELVGFSNDPQEF
jgi:hypothetical protein